MVSHFVPEMSERRSIGFSHLQSATLAFDIVSFRKGNSDHPIFVPRHDFPVLSGIVSKKMKNQSMIRILLPCPQGQVPTYQRVEEPVLRLLQVSPRLNAVRLAQIRYGPIVP